MMKSPLGGIHLSRVAGAKNLVGGVEDALRRTFANGLSMTPGLDIASAEFRSGKSQRLAAQQCDGFGLNFANFSGCNLRILEFMLIAVSENHVTGFVEHRFMR